jgi:hypothetical protein
MSPPTTSGSLEDNQVNSQVGRVNGQLTTPALSPIDERAHDPLLSRDLVELPERTNRQSGDRRRSSEARMWKLSPKQVRLPA